VGRRHAHELDDVDVVVLLQPAQLALVGLEHLHLRLDRLGHVDELGRGEAGAADRLHEVDGRDDRVVRARRLEQRKAGQEARVEHELRDLVVVGHVIAGRVRDDHVGPRLAHEVDDEPTLLGIGRVHLAVGELERDVLRAGDRSGLLGFPGPDAGDLLGAVLEAAAVAARGVAHDHLVAFPRVARERAAAEDLEVVRVCADGQDAHANYSLAAAANEKSRSSTD
jgi:hypothetical protein